MAPAHLDPSSKSRSADQRASERIEHRISIAYSFEVTALPTEKPTPFRFGMLLNISSTGLCFQARDKFCVQQIVALYLKLSDQTSGIKVLGKVLWAETDNDDFVRVGIRLIGSLPSDWRQFVESEQDSQGNRPQ